MTETAEVVNLLDYQRGVKMTPMQKAVQALRDQQNSISVALNKHAEAINKQAEMVQHNHNAIVNMMNWLGEELGEEAVDRLRKRLGVPEGVSLTAVESGEGDGE